MTNPIPIQMTTAVVAVDPARLVSWYLGPSGPRGGKRYYQRADVSTGKVNQVSLPDLGWAVLIAGRPTYQAAARLIDAPIDIAPIPKRPLHAMSNNELAKIASCIGAFMKRTNGEATYMAVSLATKLIHPKRRKSVPVLDNETIYRRFMVPGWRPGQPGSGHLPRASDVQRCLAEIRKCVADAANASLPDSPIRGR